MIRSRSLILSWTVAAALAAGPILGTAVAASDSTVVVAPGDTLSEIAERHGIDSATLAALNAITDVNRVYAGQRLRLRGEPPARAAQTAGSAPATAGTHLVRSGENLTWIARRYGVTVAAIVTTNGIDNPSRIFAGQRLTIPGAPGGSTTATSAAPAGSAPATAGTHLVRSGENLTWIARRYGVTVAAIVTTNGIDNPSRIFAGQRLTIPGQAQRAAAMPVEMARLVAARDDVRRLIVAEAARHGVPASLALAVAWHESGWRQGVVSRAGAVGVMQLLPETAAWVGETMLRAPVNVRDVRSNVGAGVRLLAHYLDRYDGKAELVLAAYYQGQRGTDRHGIYPISRPYVASILAAQRFFED